MSIESLVLLVHLIGLALGAGAALFLDFFVFKYCLAGKFRRGKYEIIKFAANIVKAGLILLWISGCVFILLLYIGESNNFYNPKIWAKVSIVSVLTINGIFIHRFVLPILYENVGLPLFSHIGKMKRVIILTSGIISTVSWLIPIVLGSLRQINLGLSFTGAYLVFFGGYLITMAVIILCGLTYFKLIGLLNRSPTKI